MEEFEKVFNDLEEIVAKMARVATGRRVIMGDQEIIPKPDGEFILLETMGIQPHIWEDNAFQTEEGVAYITHNYTVTYMLTAYRGKAYAALSRLLQAINLPVFYEKFFPDGSMYAYSSASTISPLRVPMNKQAYEVRATVMMTFNVRFIETDMAAFEDLQGIEAELHVLHPADGSQAVIDPGQ